MAMPFSLRRARIHPGDAVVQQEIAPQHYIWSNSASCHVERIPRGPDERGEPHRAEPEALTRRRMRSMRKRTKNLFGSLVCSSALLFGAFLVQFGSDLFEPRDEILPRTVGPILNTAIGLHAFSNHVLMVVDVRELN